MFSCLLRPKTAKWQSWNVCSRTYHVLVSPHVACACLFEYPPCPIIMLWHGHTCLHLNHHYVVALAHLIAGKPCPKTATWHCMHTCSQLCHVPGQPREGLCVCMPAMYHGRVSAPICTFVLSQPNHVKGVDTPVYMCTVFQSHHLTAQEGLYNCVMYQCHQLVARAWLLIHLPAISQHSHMEVQ